MTANSKATKATKATKAAKASKAAPARTAAPASTASTAAPIPTPQETAAKLQADALEAIKSYQAATVKTVEAWTEAFAALSANAPALPELPAELKVDFGDPAVVVEASYAFASQVLDLNKQFAHELLEAQKAGAEAVVGKSFGSEPTG